MRFRDVVTWRQVACAFVIFGLIAADEYDKRHPFTGLPHPSTYCQAQP